MLLANWQRCVDHLKEELPSQQFNTWIRPLQAEFSAEGLTLFAPNRFVQDWVKDKFYSRICELVLRQSGGEAIDVFLEVGKKHQEDYLSPFTQNTAANAVLEPSRPAEKPEQSFAGKILNGEALKLLHSQSHAEARSIESAEAKLQSVTMPNKRSGSAKSMDLIIEGKLRHKGSLNPENTFDNFIEGKSNQLAIAAAIQVADNPGGAYNPLFIYGGVGLGKTHLMHAIGNAMLARNPSARVVYLHSETFVATMVTALQLNAINEFKRYYRYVDALLIDDIQFFAGKERSQEEFFHTFNALLEGGQQIILTSDKYHKEINGLE